MNRTFTMFFAAFFVLFAFSASFGADDSSRLDFLLSPNVSVDSIPKDMKFPDKIMPYLTDQFNASVGKENAFDIQFKIVLLGTRVTNNSDTKYSFFQMVALSDVRNSKTQTKVKGFSPDARVLAINTLAQSSNSSYINALLTVLERDDSIHPRIAAAKAIPFLGKDELVVNKLVELLKNQYGGSRAKFKESDQGRFDEDKIAQAIVETLGEIGDPKAFPALMQVVTQADMHREETVKASWESMKKLKW